MAEYIPCPNCSATMGYFTLRRGREETSPFVCCMKCDHEFNIEWEARKIVQSSLGKKRREIAERKGS